MQFKLNPAGSSTAQGQTVSAVYYYKSSNIFGIKVGGQEVIKIGGKYLDTARSKDACVWGLIFCLIRHVREQWTISVMDMSKNSYMSHMTATLALVQSLFRRGLSSFKCLIFMLTVFQLLTRRLCDNTLSLEVRSLTARNWLCFAQ